MKAGVEKGKITIETNSKTKEHLANDLYSKRLGLVNPTAKEVIDALATATIAPTYKSAQDQYADSDSHHGKRKNNYKSYIYYSGEIQGKKVTFNVGKLKDGKVFRYILYAISPPYKGDTAL